MKIRIGETDFEWTPELRRRIVQSIAECDRYISKEERRADDLRPLSVAKTLASYKANRARLAAILDANPEGDKLNEATEATNP